MAWFFNTILMLTLLNISVIKSSDSRTEYHAHWMSIMSLFSSEEYYGFDLYNKRLFDIILPGSHHSGMYESAINKISIPSTDSYFSAISYLNDTNKYIKWSTRQRGDIYNQLISGCRFLDIRLEKSGTDNVPYYSHHGMLGASLSVMIEDIVKYMNMNSGEIIVIKISELIGITTTDLNKIYLFIMSKLGEYMANSKSKRYNILNDNIGVLIKTNGIRIIVFIDKTSVIIDQNEYNEQRYDTYFFDAIQYLSGDDELRIKTKGKKDKGNKKNKKNQYNDIIEEEQPLSKETIISNIMVQLAQGWDTNNKLNQIYWDVNIEYSSQINKYADIYDSFNAVHILFISTLRNTITKYPKLYFGNIIIIDFVEYLSIDAIIQLIMNYAYCYDLNWGASNNDCPKLTKLSKEYKINDISPNCIISDELKSQCPRSCGLCNEWMIDGMPNAPCLSSLDCSGPIYKATRELYGSDAIQLCHFTNINTNDNVGFCLSPFAKPSCGIIDFLMPDKPQYNNENEICNSPCTENFECLSGYCSSRDGICLSLATPSPTPHPTPIQGYFNRIHSNAAQSLSNSMKGLRAENCKDLTHCNDEEAYMKSLVTFGIIPIIIGSILLGIYFCTCFFFCAWSDWTKYKCCRCFDPINTKKYWWVKWIFVAMLLIVLSIITWQCVEGLNANIEMHNHLFDDTSDVSFKGEILNILDTTTARFSNVGDDTAWIAATMIIVLDEISGAIRKTEFDIDINMAPIYEALTFIANEYSDIELTATIIDPQTMQPMDIVLTCGFCETIPDYAMHINNSLKEAAASIKEIETMIQQYTSLVADQVDIGAALLQFSDATSNFTNYIDLYRVGAGYVIDVFETLDTQRQYVGTAIFVAPLFWISLFCIALALFGLMAYLAKWQKISDYVFRITWCCMMFIGSTMMIIFGVLAIVNIGWADFCVYLDNFEDDPIKNSPKSFSDGAKVMNACWSGANLFETFNLSNIQHWSDYQDNISFSLNIDLLKVLNIGSLALFSSEIELIDIDEFHTDGDLYLSYLNQIGPPCTCNCLPWGFEQSTFTREKFKNSQCFVDTSCWTDISSFLDMSKLSDALSNNLNDLAANVQDMLPSELQEKIPPNLDEMTGLPQINDLLALQESGSVNIAELNELLQNNMAVLNEMSGGEMMIPDLNSIVSDPKFSNLDGLQNMNIDINMDVVNGMNINGMTGEQLIELMIVNNNIPSAADYDATECMEYISLSYGYVMTEDVLYNETIILINKLKDEVYNLSKSYDGIFMIGIGIENVLGNITHLIMPLLQRFNSMVDDYARCGFVGEIYGGFKQVSCVYVFEDLTKITKAMMIISFLSVIAVLLALCTQYLFHPVKKLVIYRPVYAQDLDENGVEMIECPNCKHRFPLSQGVRHEYDHENCPIDMDMDINENKQSSIAFNAMHLNDDWNQYKCTMRMIFYTFAGYSPTSKYVGLYMSLQELRKFLEIVCIDESAQDIFDSIDEIGISDGKIRSDEFMDYFTNVKVNPRCVELKLHIENQVTWELLCKALKIFEEMDDDRSGKLEYGEFVKFGNEIGLNDNEIDTLFHNMDTNNSGSIDITELFEWFRSVTFKQKDRILKTRTATIEWSQSDIDELNDLKDDENKLENVNVQGLFGQLQSSVEDVVINKDDQNNNNTDHDLP